MFQNINKFFRNQTLFQSVDGVIESMKVVTESNSDRVARFAFDYAKRTGRKRITTIHKANIMHV